MPMAPLASASPSLSPTQKLTPIQKRGTGEPIKIFLVCPRGGCNSDLILAETSKYFEIASNEQSANVVVTINRINLGNSLKFEIHSEGRGVFEGTNSQFAVETGSRPTKKQEHDAMFDALKKVLFAYALLNGTAKDLKVDRAPTPVTPPPQEPENFWKSLVWEPSLNGNFNQNENSTYLSLGGRFWVSYIDEKWKHYVSTGARNNTQIFKIPGLPETRIRNDKYWATVHSIKSLGPHWGAGLFVGYEHDTQRNISKELRARTAVEYNIFPYAQAASKSLSLQYNVGLLGFDYVDTSVNGLDSENLWQQQLILRTNFVQSWGSVGGSVRGQNYLNHFKEGRIVISANTDFRILGGLILGFWGSYSFISDQRNVAAGVLNGTTILTGSSETLTSRSAYFGFNLAYRFGGSQKFNARLGSR